MSEEHGTNLLWNYYENYYCVYLARTINHFRSRHCLSDSQNVYRHRKYKANHQNPIMKKWKYSDDDRDKGVMSIGCYDCGLSYDDGYGWCDVIVPNDVWVQINPTYHEGAGLLCFNCISRRLTFLNMKDVPVKIQSGPFEIDD